MRKPIEYEMTINAVTHQMCLVLWTWRKLADELMQRTHPRSVERLSRLEGYRQPSLSISCKVKDYPYAKNEYKLVVAIYRTRMTILEQEHQQGDNWS